MRDLVAVARRVGLIEHRANDVGAPGLFQRAEHEADADFAGGDRVALRLDIVDQRGGDASNVGGIHHAQCQRHSIGRLAGGIVRHVG